MNTPGAKSMPEVVLLGGTGVPALGLGTWRMGEHAQYARREEAAVHLALDLGMSVIDTAEMYGDGGAEKIVGRVIASRRSDAFLVSKVYPHNAGRRQAIKACARSLQRLSTDHLDLYLLHWRGNVPLQETVGAFEQLRREGKILNWGVSNFDTADMQELVTLDGGDHCATNQVLYHLGERGIEWSLLSWLRSRQIPVMAYSPLGQGALLKNRKLAQLAGERGMTAAALALTWLVEQGDVIVIPQSTDATHVRANRAIASVELDKATRTALDVIFPSPQAPTRLAMI